MRSTREEDRVDHVDDAVLLVHVRDRDAGLVAFGVNDLRFAAARVGDGQRAALDGGQGGPAVAGLDLSGEVGGRYLAGHDVVGQDGRELRLVLGLDRLSTVPFGSASKACLVGAHAVNGPAPDRVSTRPAAFTAATSVVWSFELTAFSTMVFEGYIGAPPTSPVFSALIVACAEAGSGRATPDRASAAITGRMRNFMGQVS